MNINIFQYPSTVSEFEALNKSRFENAVFLTKKICPSAKLNIPSSSSSASRWGWLLGTWVQEKDNSNLPDILYEALHLVHRNKYRSSAFKSDLKALLRIVAEEMLSNGHAIKVWAETTAFYNAFLNLYRWENDKGSKSTKHGEFRKARTALKVLECKDISPKILKKYKPYYRDFYTCYVSFQENVRILLPHAKNWTWEWCDENLIYRELDSKYQVNYAQDSEDFDLLINAIECARENRKPYSNAFIKLKFFSFPMAQALWQEQAQDKLLDIFFTYYQKYRKFEDYDLNHYTSRRSILVCSKDNFMKSWLTGIAMAWNDNPPVALNEAYRVNLKKVLFELMIL